MIKEAFKAAIKSEFELLVFLTFKFIPARHPNSSYVCKAPGNRFISFSDFFAVIKNKLIKHIF